jgi:hypothetical protein
VRKVLGLAGADSERGVRYGNSKPSAIALAGRARPLRYTIGMTIKTSRLTLVGAVQAHGDPSIKQGRLHLSS